MRLTRRCPSSAVWPAAIANEQATQGYLNGEVFSRKAGWRFLAAQREALWRHFPGLHAHRRDLDPHARRAEPSSTGSATRPAYAVLEETFNQLSPEEQKQARGICSSGWWSTST